MSISLLSVKELVKRLEGCDDAEFITLLSTLRSPAYVDERLLKSELGLLATKTLALLKSSQDAAVWRGCHAAVVICSHNPLVLCAHAGQFLSAIYSKLEHKVEYYSSSAQTPQSVVVLQALAHSLESLIQLMRGKPTLSRESLVPQLKVIIPALVKLALVQPKLALPVLKTLLYKNTTTFRPFANKYRAVLCELLVKEYHHCDKETQRLICDNFAYLHLIKIAPTNGEDESQAHHKSYQDDTWRMGIFSILSKFKSVLDLCGEFLDLEQDKETQNLIKSLDLSAFMEGTKNSDFLPGLKLDMNSPLTLWEAPRRLSLLIDLLSSFLTLPTPYPVRIPLGVCISVAEGMLTMTTNYLPLKRDVRRDGELTSVISEILPQIQFVGVQLLAITSQTYGKLILSFLPSILSSLELFIPLQQKSNAVDFAKCALLKHEFLILFKVVGSFVPHMGHQLNEVELIKKLVDVSLYLTEDQSPLDVALNQAVKSIPGKNPTKQRQKKDRSNASISDLYVQPESFIFKHSVQWFSEINQFLRVVLSNWKLPSAQYLKILKYTISTSLKWKQENGCVPASFAKLLRAEVLNPGAERVSILPIAISLLKNTNDDVFDVLCHPRLPVSIVHTVKPSTEVIEEEVDEVHEYDAAGQDKIQDTFHVKDTSIAVVSSEPSKATTSQNIVEDSGPSVILTTSSVEQVFKTPNPKKRELEEQIIEFSKRTKSVAEHTGPKTVIVESSITEDSRQVIEKDVRSPIETATESHDPASEEDSEIEIPTINVSGDEESDEDNDVESA